MYRMSSGYASVLANTLSAQGLDVASLCREAGLDMKLANKPGAFLRAKGDLSIMGSGFAGLG